MYIVLGTKIVNKKRVNKKHESVCFLQPPRHSRIIIYRGTYYYNL